MLQKVHKAKVNVIQMNQAVYSKPSEETHYFISDFQQVFKHTFHTIASLFTVICVQTMYNSGPCNIFFPFFNEMNNISHHSEKRFYHIPNDVWCFSAVMQC